MYIHGRRDEKRVRETFLYLTIGDKKAAIRRDNTKTMRNPWHCEICSRTYTMGGKTMHLKTKKYSRNYYKDKPLIIL